MLSGKENKQTLNYYSANPYPLLLVDFRHQIHSSTRSGLIHDKGSRHHWVEAIPGQ